jgi:hypothetical protein
LTRDTGAPSAARKQGHNFLQPKFAKSDEHFRHDQTLCSSVCIAVIRYGNERAVKVANNSWLIKRSGYALIGFWVLNILLADVLLAWEYQVNYMCGTVVVYK